MCVNKRWQLQRLRFLPGSGWNAGTSASETRLWTSAAAPRPGDNAEEMVLPCKGGFQVSVKSQTKWSWRGLHQLKSSLSYLKR